VKRRASGTLGLIQHALGSPPDVTPVAGEDERIRELGVEPVFKRVLGLATVAFLAIAIQGPTAAAFTVAIASLTVLGPSLIWTVPVVFVFQLVLAVIWAELASHYPLSGGIYQWARFLGGEAVGFFSGLMYLTALLIVISALGFGMTAIVNGVVPSIALTTQNQVIVTLALAAVVAGLCVMPVKVVSRVNAVGVIAELLCLASFVVVFFANTRQSVSVINTTAGTTHGRSFLGAFLIGAALMVGVLTGSETAGIFAEDSQKSLVAPGRAIVISCFAVAFSTGLLLFAIILGTPNFHATVANPAGWITAALDSAVGSTGAKVFLCGAGIAVFSTTLAALMAASRLMFGMARDKQLPGVALLTRTSRRTGQPIAAIIVCAALAMVPLLFASRIHVLVAAFTGMLVLSYVLTLAALIRRRLQDWPHEEAPLSLGRWAWPLTLIGFAYTVFLMIDLLVKRPETNPDLGSYPVLWEFGVVFAVLGGAWWFLKLRPMHRRATDLAA
jgi:amino acid transporter